jgi:nitrite reductase (NO-forming)
MNSTYCFFPLFIMLLAGLLLSGCVPQPEAAAAVLTNEPLPPSLQDAGAPTIPEVVATPVEDSTTDEVHFTLETIITKGGLAFIGVGGDIDGLVNPDLFVQSDNVVRVTLINGDGMPHDLSLPDFNVKTKYVSKVGDKNEIVFQVGEKEPGIYAYFCTVAGHRQAGQEGKLILEQ